MERIADEMDSDGEPYTLDEALWVPLLDSALEATRGEFLAAVRTALEGAMEEGIAEAVVEIEHSAVSEADGDDEPYLYGFLRFDLSNPRAVEYLDRRGAALVTRVNETTRGYIRTVVRDGVERGESYNQMADRLISRFAEFAVGKPQHHIDSRAHLIAITEVGEAYSEGNLLVGQSIQAAGITMEKSWETTGDGRVSDGCLENEAAGWIPIDDVFPSGHERPLRFPGCRCVLMQRTTRDD